MTRDFRPEKADETFLVLICFPHNKGIILYALFETRIALYCDDLKCLIYFISSNVCYGLPKQLALLCC